MYRVDMSSGYSVQIMLELAILGLLKESPMHGYDLRKRLRSGFGLIASLSFGSLYPALARLERDGAVRELEPAAVSAEVIPLTGSLAGERAAFRARLAARAASTARSTVGTRGRRVYELTPRGEELFVTLLAEDSARHAGDDKSFVLRWAFARHLSEEDRLAMLARHRSRLEDRISSARRSLAAPGRPIDRYERQIADHTIDSLARDLAWVDELIATEQESSMASRTETGVS